jgi:Fe-S-cluster containining protein
MVGIQGLNVPELQNNPMDFTIKELEKIGYNIVYNFHKQCSAKTKDGCLIYEYRPNLCRSYYCHGKYWKPKKIVKNFNSC